MTGRRTFLTALAAIPLAFVRKPKQFEWEWATIIDDARPYIHSHYPVKVFRADPKWTRTLLELTRG